MSNVYTLETLKADLENKYAPVEIDCGDKTVVLRHLMRLGKADRAMVLAAIDESQEADTSTGDGIDQALEALRVVVLTVAASDGELLVSLLGDDIALYLSIIELWTDKTQPGEAQNSPA